MDFFIRAFFKATGWPGLDGPGIGSAGYDRPGVPAEFAAGLCPFELGFTEDMPGLPLP